MYKLKFYYIDDSVRFLGKYNTARTAFENARIYLGIHPDVFKIDIYEDTKLIATVYG